MRKNRDLSYNPALFLGVGLFPLVVICTDLKTALIYSLLFFLTMFLSQLLVGAFRLIIGKRVRFICYTIAILSIVYFLDSAVNELFPKSYNNIHSLIVFIFACSVIFYLLETAGEEETFGKGFSKSMSVGLGYVLSMIIVGAVREFLSFGSIFGVQLIPGYKPLVFFNGFAGGLFVVIIIAFIYNLIVNVLKRREALFKNLTNRYSEAELGEMLSSELSMSVVG